MRTAWIVVVASMVAVSGACNSSSDTQPLSDFVPVSRTPGVKQVYLSREDVQGSLVAVDVRVRNVTSVNRCDLLLVFDPRRVAYVSSAHGSFLEQDFGTVDYDLAETAPGQLRIQITRSSGGTTSAGPDDPVLLSLGFQSAVTGSTAISFAGTSTLSDETPTAIPGITFFGGAFVVP